MNKEIKDILMDKYEYLYNELNKILKSTSMEVNTLSNRERPLTKVEATRSNDIITGNKNRTSTCIAMVGVVNKEYKLLLEDESNTKIKGEQTNEKNI